MPSESSRETLHRLQAENEDLKQRFDVLTKELKTSRSQFQKNLTEKIHLDTYLTGILENLGSGAITVDLNGRITLLNQTAAIVLGHAAADVLGRSCETVLGEQAAHLRLTLEKGRDFQNQEKTLTDARGRAIPVRFSTTCLHTDTGEVLGAVETFEDLSRLQELAEQASRVNTLTALGEMSATIAHEIRNPLGGIGGFAGLLERDLDVDDPRRRLVKKIIEGIGGLNKMVSSLLNYTRPLQLNVRSVDIVGVVEDCLGFFEIDAGSRMDEIEIERHYDADILPCKADPEQIQQIVLNLLHNAVQAMPGGGSLKIDLADLDAHQDERTDLNKPCVSLTVSDTGMGMSEEVKSKLFMPFFTTKEGGNGLGLATSKKVIEAHGGDIAVESAKDKGAAFTIFIPK